MCVCVRNVWWQGLSIVFSASSITEIVLIAILVSLHSCVLLYILSPNVYAIVYWSVYVKTFCSLDKVYQIAWSFFSQKNKLINHWWTGPWVWFNDFCELWTELCIWFRVVCVWTRVQNHTLTPLSGSQLQSLLCIPLSFTMVPSCWILRVSGYSAASNFCLISITWTSSCSPSLHLPWSLYQYVLARFPMLKRVSGLVMCRGWSTLRGSRGFTRVFISLISRYSRYCMPV